MLLVLHAHACTDRCSSFPRRLPSHRPGPDPEQGARGFAYACVHEQTKFSYFPRKLARHQPGPDPEQGARGLAYACMHEQTNFPSFPCRLPRHRPDPEQGAAGRGKWQSKGCWLAGQRDAALLRLQGLPR